MTLGNDNKEIKENKNTSSSMIRMYNVADQYEILDRVGRGAYGTVFKAKGLKDGHFYAIKKLQNNDTKLQQQGFPITALRGILMIVSEISLLKQIDHPNIIKLKEIVVSKPSKRNLHRGSTFLVFEYMEHDFAGLFKMKIKYSLPEIKCFLKQLIEGVAYLHRNKIFHRDIKSANILLNDDGNVKLADFGLGRKVRYENYFTYKVVTLWYRAPQLLLGCKTYTDKIDVWSIGCVAAEFFTGQVMFRKQTEYAQMEKIYQTIGDFQANDMIVNQEFQKTYPNVQDLGPKKVYPKELSNYLQKHSPHISEVTINFIERLLHMDPKKRMSCQEALRHPFFSEKPLACTKSQIQKMKYEYHEMFRDRSIQIIRVAKGGDHQNEKSNYRPKDNLVDRDVKPRDHYDNRGRKERIPDKNTQDYHYQPRKRDEHSRPYEPRRYERARSSAYSSRSDDSGSYSSSSQSSEYSSSQRSRSRSFDNKRKYSREYREDRRPRDDYYRRQEKKRIDRRPEDKYHDKREEKYYRPHEEKKYRDLRDERRNDYEKRKDYREDSRKDERRYERRQEVSRKEYVKRDDRRDERKEYTSNRREQKRYDSRQRKYDKLEKGSSTFESKEHKYYDQRQYRRKQEHGRDKYQDDYVRRDDYDRRNEKSIYVNAKSGNKRNDYHSKSSERSQHHHYKKEKDYRHKPYHFQPNQRKPYYKKQHQGDRNH